MGKGCHTNDERENLMELGGSAHHVPPYRWYVYYESIKRELNKKLMFISSRIQLVVYYEPLKRALKHLVVYYDRENL